MVTAHPEHDAPDAAAVVGHFWPYDGPHSPERLASALAGLLAAASELPPVLTRLARRTRALDAGDDIRHDQYRAGTRTESVAAAEACAAEAADQLAASCFDAEMLASRIATARSSLVHLYHADGGER